jgi:phospholipase/carboxylesterase
MPHDTEWIPAAQKDSRALMIVLHGLGDSLEGYRWLPPALAIPEMNYLLVNAPDAYYGGYSWYDFAADPAPGVRRSRKLLLELLESQRMDGFPSERTFLFGFSQGCLMALDAGLRFPHRLGGIVGISGYVFEPEELIRELAPGAAHQPVLVTHGTHDSLIPIAPVRAQIDQLKKAGLQVEWREFSKDHTIAGSEEVAVIRNFVMARLAASL